MKIRHALTLSALLPVLAACAAKDGSADVSPAAAAPAAEAPAETAPAAETPAPAETAAPEKPAAVMQSSLCSSVPPMVTVLKPKRARSMGMAVFRAGWAQAATVLAGARCMDSARRRS